MTDTGMAAFTGDGTDNIPALRRQERREALGLFALSLPAFAILSLVILIPTGWLVWLSFLGPDGFTFSNYTAMFDRSHWLSFEKTFRIALIVTASCALLGYPVAYLMAQIRGPAVALMLAAVLFPLWTSVLVRTFAWTVLLQRKGLVNSALVASGAVDAPLPLLYNMTGTVIGMIHVMLPFMIMPLYAAMRRVDPAFLGAAASLGASPLRAFWTVYFPLTLPGFFVGMIMVFVLALGFYITPAILGGGRVITWPMQIDQALLVGSDWGLASALGVALVLATLACVLLLGRYGGLSRAMGIRP